VVVSGAADSTTDADGNTVQATDEEQAAAKETAKATAEEILAAYNSGKSLESIAGNYEKATYYNTTDAAYYDGVVGNWLFDDARKDGDTGIVDTTYGSHVMYFVGYDLPAWAASVTSDLQEKASSEWSTALSENADVQQSDFGMKFVG